MSDGALEVLGSEASKGCSHDTDLLRAGLAALVERRDAGDPVSGLAEAAARLDGLAAGHPLA
jgi:hypothetical protein